MAVKQWTKRCPSCGRTLARWKGEDEWRFLGTEILHRPTTCPGDGFVLMATPPRMSLR
jgi:hypothetical protein